MTDEAFLALDAIARTGRLDASARQHWINAFKSIRWVVQTREGLTLTADGRQARDEMAARRERVPAH